MSASKLKLSMLLEEVISIGGGRVNRAKPATLTFLAAPIDIDSPP